MRDLQNALSIFHLRNVGVPCNVGGALPNSGFSLSTPSPAFFHCSSLTADTILSSKLYIFPGLASVPFHAFIVASFCKLRHKKRPPTRILMYSLGSLLYVALDVLPSSILFTGTTPFFPVDPSLNYPPQPHPHSNTHTLMSPSTPPLPNRFSVRLRDGRMHGRAFSLQNISLQHFHSDVDVLLSSSANCKIGRGH